MKDETPDFVGTGEAAKMLGVHPGTLINWRTWGLGPKFTKVKRRVLYKRDDIKAYKDGGRS